MTDIGEVDTFLGINVNRNKNDNTISLNQSRYLKGVLNKFGMTECKGTATPLEVGLDLLKGDGDDIKVNVPYRELIGCITYATLTTRPDLCAAVNYFSGFQSCYTDDHFNHAKRMLRYIQTTIDQQMVFKKYERANILQGYSDADWAGDRNDRKSVSGYIFKVFGNTVSWCSRKQSTVSLS